jgi:hypothetical protein
MRKLAIVALAASVAVAMSRDAEASSCSHTHCMPWVAPIAYALGAGVFGLYGYGIGYYAYHDLASGEQSMSYYGSELMLHGALGGLFAGMAVKGIREREPAALITGGVLGAVHLTLATNGMRGVVRHRDEIRIPSDTLVAWTIGTVYGVNALYWGAGWAGRHDRRYGLAEVAVNAPIVLGLGYLARHELQDRNTGPALLYGGMAALSGVYVAHGVRVAMSPTKGKKKLDLLGTDLMPIVVSDGIQLVPGLGTAGSF